MTFETSSPQTSAPGCGGYILALLIFLLGLGGAAYWIVHQISQVGDRLTQVIVPGEATLRLSEPGTYMIFHERRSVVDGRVYSSRSIAGLRISLRDARGERVTLTAPSMSSTYNFDGRSGAAIFQFEVKRPGTYRLTASYDDGPSGPRIVLAVGTGFVSSLLSIVLGGLLIGFGSAIVAFVMARRVSAKRRRARQAIGVPPPRTRQPTVR